MIIQIELLVEKISEYYKMNDAYIFTSRSEPFPRVLMEALASGEIIICSHTIGSDELLSGTFYILQVLNLLDFYYYFCYIMLDICNEDSYRNFRLV